MCASGQKKIIITLYFEGLSDNLRILLFSCRTSELLLHGNKIQKLRACSCINLFSNQLLSNCWITCRTLLCAYLQRVFKCCFSCFHSSCMLWRALRHPTKITTHLKPVSELLPQVCGTRVWWPCSGSRHELHVRRKIIPNNTSFQAPWLSEHS